MDFEKVLELIISDFKSQNIRYALIGGFAMGVLGIMRSTMDLDFLIEKDDLAKIQTIMDKYHYRAVFKSENVSQFVSDVKIFGQIDFLHAFRKISRSMLQRAAEFPVLEGKVTIKILSPEDIIGLKLQAFTNDRTREMKERNDIESIVEYYEEKLNWQLIKEYCSLFNQQSYYKKLKGNYGDIK